MENNAENASLLLTEIKKHFGDYVSTEGCSCCQDEEGHKKAEHSLAYLLRPAVYSDLSGYDWEDSNPESIPYRDLRRINN